MSPFSSIVFITFGLFLTSLVEGLPFEDECDESSFDAAFYNRSTLLILKNPYLYTWKRDINVKGFSGKWISKRHRYRYWPEIDDRITAVCSSYNETEKVQIYVFMNDKMMYFYADEFNEETKIWKTFFWEHSFEELENHEYFVPTCVECYGPKIRFQNGLRYILVATKFVNSDLTEVRLCITKADFDKDYWTDTNPRLTCESMVAPESDVFEHVDELLIKTQSCSHLDQEPTLTFTEEKMIVKRKNGGQLILPVDRTLFGCVKPPSLLSEFAIFFILWIATVLSLLYFILTNPRGDDSRSKGKGRGKPDRVEVKGSKEGKDGRLVMESFSPLRQRIHLQQFRQTVGEEDTLRTIVSTG